MQANDIAIITLDSPVILSRSVGLVCLPAANSDPDQYVDQDAIIMGWGGTGGLGSSGPVDVPLVEVSGPSTGTIGGSGAGIDGSGGINKPSTGTGTTSSSVSGSGTGGANPTVPAHGSGSGASTPSGSVSSSAAGPGLSTATDSVVSSATGPAHGTSSTSGSGSSTATGSVTSTPTDPIHVSAPGTVVNGPSSGTETGPTNADGSGTSTATDPIHVGGPGTSAGPTNAGGSGTSTVIDSGNQPVSAGPSTGPENVNESPASGSSPSYGGTLINIGGITIISGKDDHHPAATSRTALNDLLQQAKVAIMSNADCRADPVIGQFVTDRTVCITSPDKFTCQVNQ